MKINKNEFKINKMKKKTIKLVSWSDVVSKHKHTHNYKETNEKGTDYGINIDKVDFMWFESENVRKSALKEFLKHPKHFKLEE